MSTLNAFENIFIQQELQLSLKAGSLIKKLYEALLNLCQNKSDYILQDLNKLCVRLVFLLYAQDAGVFKDKQFLNYLNLFEPKQLSLALQNLFLILATPKDKRIDCEILHPNVLNFPYIDGGLFDKNDLGVIPQFDNDTFNILVNDLSASFDWSAISPTIFSALFEGTLNPETRRKGGMHYTSIENIHKVIDPLFFDELKDEFETLKSKQNRRERDKQLKNFLRKLGNLTFLDPACGSGNFLTETFLSLRKLENEVIHILTSDSEYLFYFVHIKISNFFGIEINDFAVAVAKTAIWIAESQMLKKTEDIIGQSLDFLPLKHYSNIIEGNALRLDWENILSKDQCSYIMGNPPFSGARLMDEHKKQDLRYVFGSDWPNIGNLDYVTCWYKKSVEYIQGTKIKVSFVSTNSITQGEQVQILWERLFRDYSLQFIFAHRTFIWNSESISKAQIYCVIIGFACKSQDIIQDKDNTKNHSKNKCKKYIFTNGKREEVKNINPYLYDSDNVFIAPRDKPICDVPKLKIGNKPIDGGNYLFKQEEMEEFIAKEPKSKKLFKKWYGCTEFLNNKPRYCLWVGDCQREEIESMPCVLERVLNVQKYRLASKSKVTQKIAATPTRFHVENMPKETYLVIPKMNITRREYLPIGFLTPDVFCSDLVNILENCTLYHFAILSSKIHTTWVKLVAGRLGDELRYSAKIVYNNFPWPNKKKDTSKIETLAQAILDCREKHQGTALVNLYDPILMPQDLRRTHQDLDQAILALYGLRENASANDILAKLFSMYKKIRSKLYVQD